MHYRNACRFLFCCRYQRRNLLRRQTLESFLYCPSQGKILQTRVGSDSLDLEQINVYVLTDPSSVGSVPDGSADWHRRHMAGHRSVTEQL